jgi:hypothetical protein
MGAQGTATINFGAFPGQSDASVTVTGQAGILAGSLVEAWLFPTATADHSADEHVVETIEVKAGNIVAGTGFTIYAKNTNQVLEREPLQQLVQQQPSAGDMPRTIGMNPNYITSRSPMIYGQWTVAWAWN